MISRPSLLRSGLTTALAALSALGVLTACEPPPSDGSDLGVVVVAPPATGAVGQATPVVAGITNHGTDPAVGARVGYVVPDAVTVAEVTGSRVAACTGPSPVAGTSFLVGSCELGTLAPGSSTSVEIALVGVTAIGASDVHVLVSSPGEPPGTGASNQATFSHRVIAGQTIAFPDPGPVAVGSSFVVSGTAATTAVLHYVSLYVPPHLRLDSVTASGLLGSNLALPAGCSGTGSVGCTLPAGIPVDSVDLHLTALAVGGPAPVTLFSSSEFGGASAWVPIQVVDATITSDVHVAYEPVPSAVLGEPRTLRGTIRAGGPTPHVDVSVSVAVPAGFTVQSATWGVPGFPCAIAGSSVTCAVGPLAGYRTEPLVVVVVPTAITAAATIVTTVSSATPQDDPDPEPDQVELTFPVYGAFVDLALTDITLTRDPFVETTSGAVQLNVRNAGTSTATGVTLVATLPVPLTPAGGAMPQPAPAATRYCAQSGQTLTCDIGTLDAGEEQFVRLWAWTNGPTGGDVELSVTADQPETVVDPNANEATVPVSVVAPRADLSVALPGAPFAPFIVGRPRNVLLRARNLGGATATPTVTFTAPAGWVVTPVSPSCTALAQVVTCVGWAMEENDSIDFNVTLEAVAPDPGVELVASVSGGVPDPDPASNETVVVVDGVAEEVDLGLTVDAAAVPSTPGVVTHRYRIANGGPARATGVTFTATFPSSVTLLGSDYGCTFSGSTAECTRSDIGPGEETTVSLTVRYNDVSQAVTHHVAASADQPERPDQTGPNELDVVVPTAGRISGVVTLPGGAPAAGAGVRAYSLTDTWAPTTSATTAADGSYLLGNLPSGQYRVLFVPPTGSGLPSEWFDNQTSRGAGTLFPVAVGDGYVANAQLGL
jgi:hypothetical protein